VSSDPHTEPPSTPALRIKAIQQLLHEKGLLPPGAIDKIVDAFEHKLGPKIGAKVVAHAWTDPGYRKRLLANAVEAIGEFGSHDPHLAVVEQTPTIVVENTPAVHNVVAPAIPGTSWDCRPTGTRRRLTAAGSSSNPAACSPSSGFRLPTMSKSGSGIRTTSSAISSCRKGPRELRAGARNGWPRS